MRGLILGLAVGLAVLLTAGEGRAQERFLNGQKLNEYCNGGDRACMGYVMGIFDGVRMIVAAGESYRPDDFRECVPEGVAASQLTEVVKKWLREYSALWHFSADALVTKAFKDAFPCP